MFRRKTVMLFHSRSATCRFASTSIGTVYVKRESYYLQLDELQCVWGHTAI